MCMKKAINFRQIVKKYRFFVTGHVVNSNNFLKNKCYRKISIYKLKLYIRINLVYADFLTVSHKNNMLLFILKHYEIVKTETLYVDTDILELLI